MEAIATTKAPDRPGKTSVWTTAFRAGSRFHHLVPVRGPAGTQAASPAIGSLDVVRSAAWQSWRHLFPPHAIAAQTGNGSIVISWSVQDDPDASYPYAAPLMIRLEPALLDQLWNADAPQRASITRTHEATLREGMRGYDPYAKVPNARIVVIG